MLLQYNDLTFSRGSLEYRRIAPEGNPQNKLRQTKVTPQNGQDTAGV